MKNGGTERPVPFKLFLLLLSISSTPLYAQAPSTPSPVPIEQAAGNVPWHATQRDYHSQVWESSVALLDPLTGRTSVQNHVFYEIGSGINFLDQNGTWQSTRPELQISPQGYAVGQSGPHQLIVEMTNLNSATAIDFLAYDGARLRLGPVAIAWFDPLLATNYTLAVVHDCAGELTATNQVTFPNCFQANGLRASIRVSYLKAGISQDLLLHEVPDPSLMGFSKFVRLELYTELTPDSPVPAQNTRVVQSPSNDELAQAKPDAELLMDSFLDWGAYKMPAGSAFELNGNPGSDRLLVAKRHFVTPDQRPILIEAIQWSEASSLFAGLDRPKTGSSVSQEAGWKPAPLLSKAAPKERGIHSAASSTPALTVGSHPKLLARAIPPRQPAAKPGHPVQEAALRKKDPERTLLADWSLITGPTNVTLAGNRTFFVGSSIHLYGQTVIEAGMVAKFTNVTTDSGISIDGTLDCQTLPMRPAIFTSQSDDTVGEILPWSSHNPWTSHYGDPVLHISYSPSNFVAVLHDLRFSHGEGALWLMGGSGHTGTSLQFVHDRYPLHLSQSDSNLRNILIYQAETAFDGSLSCTVRVEHLTADTVQNLSTTNTTVFLTNSLLVAVTNTGTYLGASNASNNYPVNVFTTVGAGAHYLLNDTYRRLGTTNISILSEIRGRTTFGPNVFPTGVTIGNTNLVLTPQIAPDTDAQPTLGYHYPILDWAFGSVYFTNSTILITNGAALGVFCATANTYGIALGDNASLVSDASPNFQLNHIVRYNTVQEQANTNWSAYTGPAVSMIPSAGVVTAPRARFRFTDWSVLAQDADHFRTYDNGVDSIVAINHCQFHGGSLVTERATLNVTNCLFDRVALSLLGSDNPLDPTFRFCTFFGGTNFLDQESGGTWTFKDNLFDQAGLYTNITGFSHDYNAYTTNSARLLPQGSNDVILSTTNVPYQTGWLGRFYVASNSPTINASSAYATNVGLFHYCCTTNNYKETNTIADIGFHVLAVNTSGLPFDADGDGLPDAFENWHGTGHQENGESDWQNASTQTNGLNDLQVWQLSSNVQVNNPWQDAGSVTNTQFETTLVAFGNNVISTWVDTKLGITGYGEIDSNDICAWFPPTNAVPQFVVWGVSRDAGVTFSYKGSPPLFSYVADNQTNVLGNAGDPVLARETSSSTTYLLGNPQRPSVYYPNGTNQSTNVYTPLWRSTNDGESFLPPLNVFPNLLGPSKGEILDKPAMVVDNFPGTGQGDVYAAITWNTASKLLINRAEHGGTNWGITNVLNQIARQVVPQRVSLAVLTNHVVYVVWEEARSLVSCFSTNRGTNFSTPSTNFAFAHATSFNLTRSSNSVPADYFSAVIFPALTANPANSGLYLAYHDQAASVTGRPNIYILQSTNAGSNWDAVIKVNSDTTTNDHWQPAITVKPDGTKLFIAWFDRRNDQASNSQIQVYGAFADLPLSTNSFVTNFLISTAAFPPIFSGTNTNAWSFDPVYPPIFSTNDSRYCGSFEGSYSHHAGDYNTAVSDNDVVYYTWYDGRNSCTNNSVVRNQADIRYIRVSWPH